MLRNPTGIHKGERPSNCYAYSSPFPPWEQPLGSGGDNMDGGGGGTVTVRKDGDGDGDQYSSNRSLS